MHPLTIALDMDSTIYDLGTPWLEWIRVNCNEDVSAGFTRWDTHLQFPNSGMNVYGFLDLPGTFLNLKPYPGALEAIRKVHEAGHRQIFVTACTYSKTGAWEKQQAIKRDFPELKDNVIVTSGIKDVVRADMLVDDGPHNLKAFPGVRVRVAQPYNVLSIAEFHMKTTEWANYPSIVAHVAECYT